MKIFILVLVMLLTARTAAAQVQILNEFWEDGYTPTGAITLHNCGSTADLGDYSIANGDIVFTLPNVSLAEGERYVVRINAGEPVLLMTGGGVVDRIPGLQYRWRARKTAPEPVLGTFNPASWGTAHCGDPFWVVFACDLATGEEQDTFGAIKIRYR